MLRSPQHARALVRTLWGLAILCSCGIADAREPFAAYFDGLRAQGLFRLAEQYGLRRLSEGRLSSAEQSELAVELSRTFSLHALTTGGTDQEELWKRAEEILAPPLDEGRPNPRRLEAAVQRALLTIDRGLALGWNAQLDTGNPQVAESARSLLQRGIVELKSAGDTLQGEIKRGGVTSAQIADGAISPAELRRLQERVLMQLGLAHVELARVAPSTPVRTQAARDAIAVLDPLARSRSTFANEARIQKVVAFRLGGDLDQAMTLANDLANDDLPARFQDRVLAEQVRILVRQGKHPDAIARVLEARKTRPELSEEVRAEFVEALLGAWALARDRKDETLAADIWSRLSREVESMQGPWQVLARRRMETIDEVRTYGSELAGQIRLARQHYQAGRTDEALQQFAAASQTARGLGKLDAMVEIESTRASVLIRQKRYADAASALQAVLDQPPAGNKAAELSLLRAWTLGQWAAAEPSAEHRRAYLEALEQQRSRYPGNATAFEAAWLLALVRTQDEDWDAAIALLETIPPEAKSFEEARVRLARAYVERWRAARARNRDLPQAQAAAENGLKALVAGLPGLPQSWTPAQSLAALQFPRFQMMRGAAAGGGTADLGGDAVLQRIEQSVEVARRTAERDRVEMDPAWNDVLSQATRLGIVQSAAQRDFPGARARLATLQEGPPEEMLNVLLGLADVAADLPPEAQRELGRLQLDAARRLEPRRSELSPPLQRKLSECLAQAYTVTGNLPEAVDIYESLLRSEPGNRELIRTTAELLLRRGQRSDIERARGWWQKLEGLETKGSAEWLDARVRLGEAMLALGQTAEVLKLVRVTRILYPQAGDEAVRAKLSELERAAQAAGARPSAPPR